MVILVMLLLLLLPPLVCKAHVCKCKTWHPHDIRHKYLQPGDLILGGLVYLIFFTSIPKTFTKEPTGPLDEPFVAATQNYQHVLAMVFAIKEINENPRLLPNLTLGFRIYDTYLNPKWTSHAALQLLSPWDRFAPNYRCDTQDNLFAIIEGFFSTASSPIPSFLGMYKIPQLSYGYTSRSMEGTEFVSLYQMVPNEALQYKGILHLLLHFNWTWVGFFVGMHMNSEWFVKKIVPEFSRNGICFDFIDTVHKYGMDKKFSELKKWSETHDKLIKTKANVLIFYGDHHSMLIFRRFLIKIIYKDQCEKPKGEVWLLTAQQEIQSLPGSRNCTQYFHGALSVAVHSNEVQGFKKFIIRRSPSNGKGDYFLQDVWALAFSCLFPNSFLRNSQYFTSTGNCTGEEKLENLPQPYLEISMTGSSYTIYNAVYVVAHALHAMHLSKSRRTTTEGKRKKLQDFQPWQVMGERL